MVNPREKCRVALSDHAKSRCVLRGLSNADAVRMIRRGTWIAEGGVRYTVVEGEWHLHVRLRRCFILVRTVYRA